MADQEEHPPGVYFNPSVSSPGWWSFNVDAYVAHQKLLGATTVTFVVAANADADIWQSFDSREGANPPQLWIEPFSRTGDNILYASNRLLTVPEGGSAQFSVWSRLSPSHTINIMKIPGGDPDLNATVGGWIPTISTTMTRSRSPSPPRPTPMASTGPRRSS